ncbi:class I SAM-dependent methyltransferase [Agromyces sp. M3QZ16-3]|uniref:class I SAM-dependent methyltransferase n=1 Tax=Agromyces sp. M3QZ16-3 TaxID=3447585 RepID=UPI003F690E44
MRWFYEVVYRFFRAPWEVGARAELVDLVERGVIPPGRALDLGCGTGANAIFLAQRGFDVTGVDFAPSGIAKATRAAEAAGVAVDFLIDDLTDLRRAQGPFDFLLDYGVLDDLRARDRRRYLRSILPLTRPGTRYLLWGFEYPIRWWERLIPFFDRPFADGEVAELFGDHFRIATVERRFDPRTWPPGTVTYLMTRT